MPLTDQLNALELMEKAATPGPWDNGGQAPISITFDRECNIFPPDTTKTHGFQFGGPVAVVQDNGEASDAPLIAALRNAAPEVIEVLRAAQRGCDAYSFAHKDSCLCTWCQIKNALAALSAVLPSVGGDEVK